MNKRVFLAVVITALLTVLPVTVTAQDLEELGRTRLWFDAPPYGVRGPYTVGY